MGSKRKVALYVASSVAGLMVVIVWIYCLAFIDSCPAVDYTPKHRPIDLRKLIWHFTGARLPQSSGDIRLYQGAGRDGVFWIKAAVPKAELSGFMRRLSHEWSEAPAEAPVKVPGAITSWWRLPPEGIRSYHDFVAGDAAGKSGSWWYVDMDSGTVFGCHVRNRRR